MNSTHPDKKRLRFRWFFDGRYIRGNSVRLLTTGDELFPALESLIHHAQNHIHIECYIFREDEVGIRIADALKEAVRRGVIVHVLLDAVGCIGLSAKFINDLQHGGVELRFFHPIWGALVKLEVLNFRRRLHRKVFLADGDTAIVGGINIGNEYSSASGRVAWLDYGVLVRGPAGYHLQKIVERTWARSGGAYFFKKGVAEHIKDQGGVLIAIVRNFFLTGLYDIYFSYIGAIRRAQESIIIANAYFLPGLRERIELKDAVSRGVRVRVIVPSAPDVRIMRFATRSLYRFLLKHGVEVYEWKPSMMHAKVAVVDDKWSTVGSHNLDHLSKFYNLELNINVRDRDFSAQLARSLDAATQQCEKISAAQWMGRSYLTRIFEWICFQLVQVYSGFGGKVIRRASRRMSRSR